MKASLETMTCKIMLVIRKNVEIPQGDLKTFCETYFSRWAFIEHKNDVNPNGEIEGVHYHIVGTLPTRKRLATMLNVVADFFKFDNTNGIEIDKCNCLEGAYQYLIHKNDEEKTPHKLEEVVTNIPNEEFKALMESHFTDTSITADRIYSLVLANVRYDYQANKCRVDYVNIAREVGITRLQCISWILQKIIEQVCEDVQKSIAFDDLPNNGND